MPRDQYYLNNSAVLSLLIYNFYKRILIKSKNDKKFTSKKIDNEWKSNKAKVTIYILQLNENKDWLAKRRKHGCLAFTITNKQTNARLLPERTILDN